MADEEIQKKVGLESLAKAKLYNENKTYGRAFAHYLVYFQLFPNNKMEHLEDFIETLYNWGMYLESTDRVENLCKCYIQAMTHFPESIDILNNFGAHLLRLGEADAAKRYVELAYKLDSDYLPAEKNYLAVKLSLISRWHFRMLNDIIRNTAYYLAIRKCIDDKYNHVIDIGTGSGILSLFAFQIPHVHSVTAIEESKALSKIAKTVFDANNANITLINKHSTDLQLHEIRGNILVTEIFDAALFGEHILETLIHAWNFILNKEDSKVIPDTADVFITGIHSVELFRTHKLMETIPELALDIGCITKLNTEPYDAENLREKNVQYMTNVQAIVRVNFNDCNQLEQMYFRKDFFKPVTLQCIENGTLQAFAVWFDLNLDKDISITSSPLVDNVKCWDQAIFYLKHPIEVKKGDQIQLQISIPSERFEIKVLNHKEETCTKCVQVSQRIIQFLNDKKLIEQIAKLPDCFESHGEMSVLDLNVFPLFGLLMAKRGAQVYCAADTVEDRRFLTHLSTVNKLDDNLHVVFSEQLDQVVESLDPLNVLFLYPITYEGLISEQYLGDLSICCRNLQGDVLPNSIKLVFEIIESEHLDYLNKVNDDNLLGFRISEFFNDYVANEQPLVTKLPHKKLSKSVKTINIMRSSDDPVISFVDVPVTENGCANALYYWYEIEFYPGISYDTRDSSYSSRACFLLPEPKKIAIGDIVKVKFKMHKGYVSLYCVDE